AYFRTLPSPGTPPVPDRFQTEVTDPLRERYSMKVRFSDTSRIQKVAFLVNGTLVGADFSANNGQFEVDLNPSELWADRNMFYHANEAHQVQVQVTSASGSVTTYPFTFTPSPTMRIIRGYFITPEENKIIYIPGAVAPNITIGVNIYASQLEWSCEWVQGSGRDCADMEKDVAKVELYVGAQKIGTQWTTTRMHTYHFDWNIKNLSAGQHLLQARVYDTDGSITLVDRPVAIQTGEVTLTLERLVARDGNHFDVTLTIKNESPAGLPVTLQRIYDSMIGFQPVNGTDGDFTLQTLTGTDGVYQRADIYANHKVLNPGSAISVKYEMAPILYKDPTAVVSRIGATNIIGGSSAWIEYTLNGASKTAGFNQETLEVEDASAPGGWSSIPLAISKAFAGSDYLIVTSPEKMSALYWSMWDISSVMGNLARLAVLKNGVVAYWPASASRDSLNHLLEDNSAWSNRLHPNFETRGKGYVLLVGESDIIASYTTGPFDVNWAGSDAGQTVQYSDNPYAHTDGNGAPDLLLGRIVGSSASRLNKAVLTSIRTHLGELTNQMAKAYVGSGTGNGEDGMQADADTAAQYFTSRGMTATKQHWETSGWLRRWDFAYAKHDGFGAGDLDGDGNDEILIASCADNAVYIFNGDTGQVLSSFPLDFEAGDGFVLGDVDDDNKDEIIHGDRGDKIQIIGLENSQWITKKIFSLDFDAGDGLAVGRMVTANPGVEIIKADYATDKITIYDQNGSLLLPAIDLRSMGYAFELYDALAAGNVGISQSSADEILISDRTHQKIVIFGADGDLIKEMAVSFAQGDQLAVGDVTPDLTDEIIISDSRDSVHVYRGRNNDSSLAFTLLRSIYKDIESYDGLTVRKVVGFDNDEIFHADRSHDRIITLDAYYPNANRQVFKAAAANQDLLWFYAHGSPTSMEPSVDNSVFPINFNGTAPIINAFSCSTGNYESGGNNSLVVQFFNSGAGGYFGSTEVSPMDKNSNMSRKLYSEFWDAGEPLIKSILQLKNNRWGVSEFYDWWWLVVNEYNYYGDPKFQLTSAGA
ncbi:MAG: hypothetical protein IH586_04800, partial [Anaerolineaceae bacterium]|nr:hypothetical protein [Anaerolineaceae bacterium]